MNRSRQWRLVGSAVGGEHHFWRDKIIFGLDRVLRRWQSVVEYTHDPTCILRIKFGRLDQDVVLSDGTAGHVGDRFIDLHLWNEQVPAMPKEGASIAWARQMSLCFQHSLRQLARYLAARSDLDDISLVRCTLEFAGRERNDQMVRLISDKVNKCCGSSLERRAHPKAALRRSGWADRARLGTDAICAAAIALFEHLA